MALPSRRGTPPRPPPAVLAALLALSCLPGCWSANEMIAGAASRGRPYQEYARDPIALAAIHTVAVLPFDNRAPGPGFNGEEFAVKLASQLGGRGQFKVLYPQDFIDLASRQNRADGRRRDELATRLRLGLPLAEADEAWLRGDPRREVDPVRNLDDALRLARRLEADAVITGYATDFDASVRPRLAITLRLVATGRSEAATRALAAMAVSGVPLDGGGGGARQIIYTRQQVFDSREGNVNRSVRAYTTTHVTDHHPDGYRAYTSSMSRYYDVCANQLAASLAKTRGEAVAETRRLARLRSRNGTAGDASVDRLLARRARDAELPDTETRLRPAGHYDRHLPDARSVLDREDDRLMSWRGDGAAIREPHGEERVLRDRATGPDARDIALAGYAPDADGLWDRSSDPEGPDDFWRPAVYAARRPDRALRAAERDGGPDSPYD